jgi:hypothetical protein
MQEFVLKVCCTRTLSNIRKLTQYVYKQQHNMVKDIKLCINVNAQFVILI